MKSLIKKNRKTSCCTTAEKPKAPPREKTEAQCCAKVSKAVAGCHD